mgnify:CR=1 FL=1
MSKAEAKTNLFHTISKLTGARKPELCPECKSDKWFRHREFVETFKDYDDGYSEARGTDYQFTTYQCEDCGWDE